MIDGTEDQDRGAYMIDSGEHDAPPPALELARDILHATSHAMSALQNTHGAALAATLASRLGEINAAAMHLIVALTPPPPIPDPSHEIPAMDWRD